MEAARLYEVRGGAGEVIAILRGVPCHICPEDEHPRAYSSNDFRSKLSEAVFGGTFPATRPGRLRKTVCFSCGKRLKQTPAVEGKLEERILIDGADMTLILTAPLIDCPHCGRSQLDARPAVSARVQEALDAALVRGRLRS
jgi:hypothetical protein